MTLNGPDRLVSGRTGTFTVTPNRAAQVQWSSNQVACPLVPDADNQNTARLTCAADFDGTVQVTAVGVHDGQTLTRTKSIPVSPTPVEVLRDTTVNLTVSGKQIPHHVHGRAQGPKHRQGHRVRDRHLGVPDPHRRLQPRHGTSSSTVTVPRPSRWLSTEVATTGSPSEAPTPSGRRSPLNAAAYVYARVTNKATRTGLTATLKTGSGRAIAKKSLLLQKRVVGTSKWVNVKQYTTSTKGTVSIRINPRRRTDYRWSFAGDSTYTASISGVVRRI